MKKGTIRPRERIKNLQVYDENNRLVFIIHENGVTKIDKNYDFQFTSYKKDYGLYKGKFIAIKHSFVERIEDWFFKDINSTVSIVAILVSVVTTVSLLLLLGWLQLIPL